MHRALIAAVALLLAGGLAAQGVKLGEPTRLMDGGEAINVDIGHAAPWVYDFDGDGKRDLLVGQFGDGKLRIYTNKGTNEAPKYDGFTWLQAGGADATVPTG